MQREREGEQVTQGGGGHSGKDFIPGALLGGDGMGLATQLDHLGIEGLEPPVAGLPEEGQLLSSCSLLVFGLFGQRLQLKSELLLGRSLSVPAGL